jgi:hypothetical protein
MRMRTQGAQGTRVADKAAISRRVRERAFTIISARRNIVDKTLTKPPSQIANIDLLDEQCNKISKKSEAHPADTPTRMGIQLH